MCIYVKVFAIGEKVDDWKAIVGTCPMDGETLIFIFATGELRVCLVDYSVMPFVIDGGGVAHVQECLDGICCTHSQLADVSLHLVPETNILCPSRHAAWIANLSSSDMFNLLD